MAPCASKKSRRAGSLVISHFVLGTSHVHNLPLPCRSRNVLCLDYYMVVWSAPCISYFLTIEACHSYAREPASVTFWLDSKGVTCFFFRRTFIAGLTSSFCCSFLSSTGLSNNLSFSGAMGCSLGVDWRG